MRTSDENVWTSSDWRTTRLRWVVGSTTNIVRRFGELLQKKKKTRHAMVRFLATPGNSSGGGTYLVRTRFETHQRGRELQASLGVKTVTKASA